MKKEIIGNATLYLGDCMDILETLNKVDAIVTDPPYGIGESSNNNASRSKLAIAKNYGCDHWDDKPVNQEFINFIITKANKTIMFGGNYYAMPPSKCWFVWDKENGASDFADAELAWTNLDKAVRLKRFMWNGMLRANKEIRGDHPTQKPIGLMEWCISHLPNNTQTILDPFMGSGTTGVASMNMKKTFIGIEREQKYFDIACKRIEQSQKQLCLF
jgi:site-specific DNA-methyltransferase (adenine-specific)/modification methylase